MPLIKVGLLFAFSDFIIRTKVLHASHVKERVRGHNWVLDPQQAAQKELADPTQIKHTKQPLVHNKNGI